MTNDQLHEDAVKLLLQRQRNATETTAKGVVKSYNQRRREATAKLQPILTQIWDALERGESVGGHCGKEDWASSQSITIRQIQRIIAGTPQKRHDVVLKVGMTVKVNDMKVVLTQAMINLLVPYDELRDVKPCYEVQHIRKDGDTAFCGATTKFTWMGFPAKRPPKWRSKMPQCVACYKAADTPLQKKKAFYKVGRDSRSLGIRTKAYPRDAACGPLLHAKEQLGNGMTAVCGASLEFGDNMSDDFANEGKGKSINCPRCLEKRAARAKQAAETRAMRKSLRNNPLVQDALAKMATV